jgi:serine/threonine protein kinase
VSSPAKLRARYELREIISRGAMGIIYRSYDTVMRREVALKTIVDVGGRGAVEMFQKEWKVQASLIHPNVVEIFDIGDCEDDGVVKPYFVMPLLPGVTLAQLIKSSSHRLTVERSLDIIRQICRGLQAAHESGLVHRDLKPSNIFVMDDDSVKIIDFGLVHIQSGGATQAVKGTLPYMAPELLEMKAPSVLTDIFALGAVCYETLTLRRAFEGSSDAEISRAILHQNPPPINEINKDVSKLIGRVVHKAMAKQPWHRFQSAREFGDTLQKALRNEPIEFFEPTRVLPRVSRAAKAFERGEYQIAAEILSELEGEGHIDQEIIHLRCQVEQAVRQIAIQQLLKSAQQFLEEEEYPLSLRKLQDALQKDPNDAAALALKNQVESKQREKAIDEWSHVALCDLENNAFTHARVAIQNLLVLKPSDTEALEMMAEVDRREREYERVRQQKAEIYGSAVDAWQRGEVAAAVNRLERWVAMEREAPEIDSARLLSCQKFYSQVHAEQKAIQNSYEEAKKRLAAQDLSGALALCELYLSKYPGHALFQSMQYDIEEWKSHSISALSAATDWSAENEPDLGKRCNILESALELHPGELYFVKALQLARDKRDLVNTVAAKARLYEEQGHFSEAIDQWEILRAIHGQYAGLDHEIERLNQRRVAQSRSEVKSEYINQVERCLEPKDYGRAIEAAKDALSECSQDAEPAELDPNHALSRNVRALITDNRSTVLSAPGAADTEAECIVAGVQPGVPANVKAEAAPTAYSASAVMSSPPPTAAPRIPAVSAQPWPDVLRNFIQRRVPLTVAVSGALLVLLVTGTYELARRNLGVASANGVRIDSRPLAGTARLINDNKGAEPSLTDKSVDVTNPHIGVLSIVTGEDNVHVYLNNKLFRGTTQGGNLRIPNLTAGRYRVRVSKDGYQADPAQTVEIGKRAETKVVFRLKAAGRMAVLQILGARAGARVMVDGTPVGTIDSDGGFRIEVTSGKHSVELRKDGAKSQALTRSFSEGRSTLLAGPDLTFDSAPATSPVLSPTMARWENPSNWIPDGQWYVRKGGDFVPYHVSPVNGAFTFTVMLRKGKRLQWAVNRTDDKNYILFKMDKKNFERCEVVDGKSKVMAKLEHGLIGDQGYTLKVDVSPNRVEHSIQRGENWFVIDGSSQIGRGFDRGMFGFVIPGRDEFAVSSFTFHPHGRSK